MIAIVKDVDGYEICLVSSETFDRAVLEAADWIGPDWGLRRRLLAARALEEEERAASSDLAASAAAAPAGGGGGRSQGGGSKILMKPDAPLVNTISFRLLALMNEATLSRAASYCSVASRDSACAPECPQCAQCPRNKPPATECVHHAHLPVLWHLSQVRAVLCALPTL